MAERRLPGTIAEVLKLESDQFEEGVADLLRRLDYRSVQLVGGRGDLGVDITGQDNEGRSVVVQCKKYNPESHKIRSPDIRNFFGGMQSVEYKADKGLFVTTSEFTRDARKFAKRNDITLIDGKELLNLIQQAYRGKKIAPDAGEAATARRKEIGAIFAGPAPGLKESQAHSTPRAAEKSNAATLYQASRTGDVVNYMTAILEETKRLDASWGCKKADLIWAEYEKKFPSNFRPERTILEEVRAENALRRDLCRDCGKEGLEAWLKHQKILSQWLTLRSILTLGPLHPFSRTRYYWEDFGPQEMRKSRTNGRREKFAGLIPDALRNYAICPHDPERVKMDKIPDSIFAKSQSQVKDWLQHTLTYLHWDWHVVLAVPAMNEAGEIVPEGVRVPALMVRTEWTRSHEGVRSNTLLVWLEEAPSAEHNPQSGAISFDAL
ncbi:MAG: restriction endonuclease [Rhodospirillaceae bacterium]|nr:restriction endonuclease [Rhodospirillaceae bacterium]